MTNAKDGPAPELKPTVFLTVKVAHDTGMRHVATIRNEEFWSWLTKQAQVASNTSTPAETFEDREFQLMSDEPAVQGGTDSYPSPLEYFLAGVGFCQISQVLRYAKRLRINVDDIRVSVDASWGQEGSFWAGTMLSRVTDVSTTMEITADALPETISTLVHNAKAGCFAEAALRDPVNVKTTATLNGKALDYESFPKQPSRHSTSET